MPGIETPFVATVTTRPAEWFALPFVAAIGDRGRTQSKYSIRHKVPMFLGESPARRSRTRVDISQCPSGNIHKKTLLLLPGSTHSYREYCPHYREDPALTVWYKSPETAYRTENIP